VSWSLNFVLFKSKNGPSDTYSYILCQFRHRPSFDFQLQIEYSFYFKWLLANRILVRKREVRNHFENLVIGGKYSIFKEMGWESLDWIRLSQDRELLWVFFEHVNEPPISRRISWLAKRLTKISAIRRSRSRSEMSPLMRKIKECDKSVGIIAIWHLKMGVGGQIVETLCISGIGTLTQHNIRTMN
jgi:hypothetical protein